MDKTDEIRNLDDAAMAGEDLMTVVSSVTRDRAF